MSQSPRSLSLSVQSELASVEEETAEYNRRYKTATSTLDQLKTGTTVPPYTPSHLHPSLSGIDSVFTKTGCDPTAITDLLGGHAGVTDSTILQYLGIVEQKTNELLQLQSFIQAKVYMIG